MIGVEIASAVMLSAEVSDVSNSARCALSWLVCSRIVDRSAILLLCLTPSVVRKLMLELGKLTVVCTLQIGV